MAADNVLVVLGGFKRLISSSYESYGKECNGMGGYGNGNGSRGKGGYGNGNGSYGKRSYGGEECPGDDWKHERLADDIRMSLSDLLTLNSKLDRIRKETSSSSSPSSSLAPRASVAPPVTSSSSSSPASPSVVNHLEHLESSAWENCEVVLKWRIVQVTNDCLSNNKASCHSIMSGPERERFEKLRRKLTSKDEEEEEEEEDDDGHGGGGNNGGGVAGGSGVRVGADPESTARRSNPASRSDSHDQPDNGQALITLAEGKSFDCKLFTMSADASINGSSVNSDSDSPEVRFSLDKNKRNSIISFSKSKSVSFDKDSTTTTTTTTTQNNNKMTNGSTNERDSTTTTTTASDQSDEPTKSRDAKASGPRSNFVILSFVDERSGSTIPLQSAIERRIVDRKCSTYRDPATGSAMSLGEAATKGKVVLRPIEDGLTSFENPVVDNAVGAIKRSKRVVCRLPPGEEFGPAAVRPSARDLEKFVDPCKVSGRSADFLETPLRLSVNGGGGGGGLTNAQTVKQALSRGILTFDDVTFCGEGGRVEVKSLREAATSGLLDVSVYEGLVRIAEEQSLENVIKGSGRAVAPAAAAATAAPTAATAAAAAADDDDDDNDLDDGKSAFPRKSALAPSSTDGTSKREMTSHPPANGKTDIASQHQQQQQQEEQQHHQQQQQQRDETPSKMAAGPWLEPLAEVDASKVFVTDLTRCNEVVTLSGWLKKTQRGMPEVNNSSKSNCNNNNNNNSRKSEGVRIAVAATTTTTAAAVASTTSNNKPTTATTATTTPTALKSRALKTTTPTTATTTTNSTPPSTKPRKPTAGPTAAPPGRAGHAPPPAAKPTTTSTAGSIGQRVDSKKPTKGSLVQPRSGSNKQRPTTTNAETTSDGKYGKDGKDGKYGKDGKDGKDGKANGANRLGPDAVRSVKKALMQNRLSSKVSAVECVERVRALRFLTARDVDVDKDLFYSGYESVPAPAVPDSQPVSRLPKLRSHRLESRNSIAPHPPQHHPSSTTDSKPTKSASLAKSLTVREAILTGRLDIGSGRLTTDGASYSIYDGTKPSELNSETAGAILGAVADSSLARLLRLEELVPDFDEQTLREFSPISLERSVKEGLLDPSTVFYYDAGVGRMRSLASAIDGGSFDLRSACFVGADGARVGIGEAAASGLVEIDLTADKVRTWLDERKADRKGGDVANGQSEEGRKVDPLALARRAKLVEALEKVEREIAGWKDGDGDFDASAVEESLKSAGDALIVLVNSGLNWKRKRTDVTGGGGGGGRRNGCHRTKEDDDDEDLKKRLLQAWTEFENIKLNLKNDKKSLEAWIKDAEERLEGFTSPTSLDLEKLSAQIDKVSSLKEESAKRKKQEACLKSNADAVDKVTSLLERVDAKLRRLSDLKECLAGLHGAMDDMDKWIVDAGIEARKLLDKRFAEISGFGFGSGSGAIDKFTECHEAIRAKRPVMDELKLVVDHLSACAKGRRQRIPSSPGGEREAEGSDPSTALRACTQVAGERLDEVLHRGDRLRLANESSIAGVFVDLHANFHDLDDLLVEKAAYFAQTHFCSVSEYLEKAESDVREVFVASFDPEVLNQQLGDAKSSHEELFQKFSSVQEIAEKLGPIIQSPLDDELGNASDQMNDVCSKFKSVMELSDAKVEKLEEAVSLAVQLKEMQTEVENALMDVESLVEFVEIPTNGNPEEIKNELESSKLAREALLEQLVMVDALVNKSHDLLELLSLEKCQEQLDRPFIEVRQKFDRLNEQLNDKTNGIIQAWRESTTSLADASDSFLEELYKISDAIHLSDPVSPDVETIRRQINENKALTENLAACSRSLEHLKRMLVQLHATSVPTSSDRTGEDQQAICDDLANQLNDLELMHRVAASNVQARSAKLREALEAAERYEGRFQLTRSRLLEHLESVDVDFRSARPGSPAGSEDAGAGDDEEEEEEEEEDSEISNDDNRTRLHIQNLMEELSLRAKEADELRSLGGELRRLCEDGAEFKVDRDCSTISDLVERLREAIGHKKEELDLGEDLTLKFEDTHRNLSSWMNETEEKLSRLIGSGVASEMRAVKIQIEELKVFMRQLHPHLPDLENINHLAEMISAKTTHTSFIARVQVLNETWNRILRATNDREVALSEALVEIGELDQTMDDIIGHLQQVEADIQTLDEACGDPKYIEAHLKNIEMLLDNVDNQLPSIRKLNERINTALLKSCPTRSIPSSADSTPSSTPSGSREGTGLLPPSKLSSKLRELNETYETVHCMARQKKNYLIDCLKEVKDFMRTVEDLSGWFTKYCKQLRSIPMPGALPTTVQNEYQKFMKHHQDLERKLDESRMLLFNGEEMKLRCREEQAVDLQLGLVKLEAQACDAVIKSKLEKERLEDHMKKVQVFHAAMNHHDNWMGGAERELSAKFKTPSKLLKTVVEQMSQHKEFKEEVTQSQDRVHNLDLTGTYLKYFGSKKDASHVKMQLFGSKSRWKRLVMRTEERGRNLQRAYREDHRFFLSWRELRNWLSDVVAKVQEIECLPIDQVAASNEVIKKIQLELPTKQCVLHSTLRQGRHLRDRCTPVDPERKVLEEMIEDIRDKWREACRAVNSCERRQCERLLESRQVSEACRAVEDTLVKVISDLRQEADAIRGDLHAVRIVKEQHLAMKEEIESKKEDVEKLASLGNVEESTKLKLGNLCEQAGQLWHERMQLIEEALSLAQKFNDSLTKCCDRLNRIEQQVNEIPLNLHVNFSKEEKFEVTLEKLKKIEEDLKSAEDSLSELNLAHREILGRAQSSSLASVNHSKSLADAQMHKLKKSVAHRRRTLEEGLDKTRRDREVLDGLLAWISNELAHLALKENNSVPEDLSTADALFKEHLDFHNELTEKKKIVERFLTPCQSKSRGSGNASSNASNNVNNANISIGSGNQASSNSGARQAANPTNPKLVNLSNKWKLIWKVSHDRKRKLQEIFSKLLEVRASSQFNFPKWCARFSNFVSTRRIDVHEVFFHHRQLLLQQQQQQQSINNGNNNIGRRDSSFAIGRKEFTDALLAMKFQCKPGDVNAAFDELDSDKSGEIRFKELIQKLNLEPKKLRSRPVTDAEQIHRNIEEQLTHCRCHQRYLVNKVSDGKYRFGDKGKLCLVRFLNSMVMVRVGGGWVTLSKYLEGNDPCRTKGRQDWKEKFVLAEGSSQSRLAFQQKRKSTSAANSGDSSHQLQSPSDSSRSPYCSSSRHRSDNSGSSTPAGRKTPTSARSRTPDFLGNPSPTSSVHSLSSKSHKPSAPNPKLSKIPLGQKSALQNGTKAPLGGSRASVGGGSSDGGSPMPRRNSGLRGSKS